MLTPFERLIAFRYLRARRKEGFVSLITAFSLAGIALGVAALIVITSIMNGVKGEMLQHIIGWNGHINLYAQHGAVGDYDALAKTILKIDGVKEVRPVIEGQVLVAANGKANGAQVSAFRYDDLLSKTGLTEKITQGDLEDFKQGSGIIIGERMAQNLGIRLGGSIMLVSPEGRQTIAGLMPRVKSYPVVGIFKFGMNSYDANLVLMPFGEAQIYFKLADSGLDLVSGLEIMAESFNAAPRISKAIDTATNRTYRVYDWQESNRSIFDALDVQENVFFTILTLIIMVAAFNIISSLIMLVSDKGRDIAILRTMGASRASIQRIFLGCGSMIGVMGTAIGLALGLLLAPNIDNIRIWIEKISGGKILAEQLYFLSTLPSDVQLGDVIGVACMSLALAFLATLYPARRAASLDPAEALRYE